MVDYYELSDMSNNSTVGNLLSIPNGAYPYFWAWIFAGLFVISTLSLYFNERARKGASNILSCMAISAFAVMMLTVLGTIVGFVTNQIMVYVLVFGFLIIGVWFFSQE